MHLYKEYQTLENGQQIRFTISFNRDRTSLATSQTIDIGYRVCVVPVEITKLEGGFQMESIGAYTGFNATLLKVERQSAKRLDAAIGELNLKREMYLDYFRVKFKLMTFDAYNEKHSEGQPA